MARIFAAVALVLAPCRPITMPPQTSAPTGVVTSVEATPRASAASTAATPAVRTAPAVRVKVSSPVVRHSDRPATKGAAHRLLVLSQPAVPARTAARARPLTARQFAATLPAPWPAIVRCESLNDGSWRVGSDSTARGLFQFLRSSWRLVGGHGDPAAATFGDQWSRAKALLRLQGWAAWDCARIIGVR